MAKGCSVEDHSSPGVPSVSHNRCSHTVLCPSQKEPSSALTLQQIVPWPPSQQSSPSWLFYSWHLNCSTFHLGKKASLSGACRSQVVSIPRARQDTELPVRVNTQSHAKHLSFWLGLNSQYSLWKGRDFTETERLFYSGLEATWTFNHIWNPVRLKAAHFVGRMYPNFPPICWELAASLRDLLCRDTTSVDALLLSLYLRHHHGITEGALGIIYKLERNVLLKNSSDLP